MDFVRVAHRYGRSSSAAVNDRPFARFRRPGRPADPPAPDSAVAAGCDDQQRHCLGRRCRTRRAHAATDCAREQCNRRGAMSRDGRSPRSWVASSATCLDPAWGAVVPRCDHLGTNRRYVVAASPIPISALARSALRRDGCRPAVRRRGDRVLPSSSRRTRDDRPPRRVRTPQPSNRGDRGDVKARGPPWRTISPDAGYCADLNMNTTGGHVPACAWPVTTKP